MELMLRYNGRPISFFRALLMALLVALSASMAVPAVAASSQSSENYFPLPEKVTPSKDDGREWLNLDERIRKIEETLGKTPEVNEQQLLSWQKEMDSLHVSVVAYIRQLQAEVDRLASELETLGAAAPNEPKAIAEQRKQILRQKSVLDGRLVGYRLLRLHNETLQKSLQDKRQKLLAERFFVRGPNSYTLLVDNPELTLDWLSGSWRFATQKSGLESLDLLQLVIIGLLIAAALFSGGLLRRHCAQWSGAHTSEEYRYAPILVAAIGRYAPHLLASAVTALGALTLFNVSPYPFVYYFGISLPVFFVGWTLLRLLLDNNGVMTQLFQLPGQVARGLRRGLKLFLLIIYAGSLIFNTDVMAVMTEPARYLLRDVYVLMIVLALLWTIGHLRLLMFSHGFRALFILLLLILFSTVVTEVSGYRNFAYWTLRAVFGTGLGFFFAWLLSQLLNELFDGMRNGSQPWQCGLRSLLGYGVKESMPWLGWMHLLVTSLVWLGFIYATLLVWGLPGEVLSSVSGYLLDGFTVGSLTIVPLRIVVAILVFSLLLAFSGWLRGQLDSEWLRKSRMERGSREALVTIIGYIGVALAILIALAVAGVQFTNLAIIAGALSVGIGFGLQNIVNNFVSGLILLFERPVKTGDWIVVGNTEGHVKRISIRSTLIETFDRADVIVPNSELISGQVTNWMLRDARGRVRVPVGVAYGTDTQKVKDILLHIAGEHSNVITDGSVSEPKVLFMNFGDSSLNFELRAFIRNIDERLQVVSDMNFAIDAAFRKEGIEIPFPQRDVHIYNAPPRDTGKE